MADIKQAAKWMQEGKRVRRKSWPSRPDWFKYLEKRNKFGSLQDDVGCIHGLHLEELLADDWELAD